MLKQLQENYLSRLVNLKYNYATELLSYISDAVYSKILDEHQELFAPIASESADQYLHQPLILDQIIQVLENAFNEQENSLRQQVINSLDGLDETNTKKVLRYISELQ